MLLKQTSGDSVNLGGTMTIVRSMLFGENSRGNAGCSDTENMFPTCLVMGTKWLFELFDIR